MCIPNPSTTNELGVYIGFKNYSWTICPLDKNLQKNTKVPPQKTQKQKSTKKEKQQQQKKKNNQKNKTKHHNPHPKKKH